MSDPRLIGVMTQQQKELVRLTKALEVVGSNTERIAVALEMLFAARIIEHGGVEKLVEQVADTMQAVGMAGATSERGFVPPQE